LNSLSRNSRASSVAKIAAGGIGWGLQTLIGF
jgi:hypothetical protein